MVFDPERGCVRGRNWQNISPEQTTVSLRLEDELAKWGQALATPIHAPLQIKLDEIYVNILGGKKVVELSRVEHPVFPGFTPYGLEVGPGETPVNLAYRCGSQRIIYAGRPEIKESAERSGFIDFNCGVCKSTMYSEEVEPNRCRGLLAPDSLPQNSDALNLDED